MAERRNRVRGDSGQRTAVVTKQSLQVGIISAFKTMPAKIKMSAGKIKGASSSLESREIAVDER
jgi:hypothetical protein